MRRLEIDAGGLKPEVVCRPAAASPKSAATPRPAEMRTRRGARKCFAKSVCLGRKRENCVRARRWASKHHGDAPTRPRGGSRDLYVREALRGSGGFTLGSVCTAKARAGGCGGGRTPARCKDGGWRLTIDGTPLLGNSYRGGRRSGLSVWSRRVPWCDAGRALPSAASLLMLPGGSSSRRTPAGRAGGRCSWRGLLRGGQQCVWDVLELAAVSAMKAGLRYVAAASEAAEGVPPGVVLRDCAIRRPLGGSRQQQPSLC